MSRVREAQTPDRVVERARAAAGLTAFEAIVAGLGAYPSPARARVIWAGVGRGTDALVELAGRVDAALAGLGFEREPRAFSPHVTLRRVRVPRREPSLADRKIPRLNSRHQISS